MGCLGGGLLLLLLKLAIEFFPDDDMTGFGCLALGFANLEALLAIFLHPEIL